MFYSLPCTRAKLDFVKDDERISFYKINMELELKLKKEVVDIGKVIKKFRNSL